MQTLLFPSKVCTVYAQCVYDTDTRKRLGEFLATKYGVAE